MGVPTFIVGTGRCGSTMLSNMLREHPKVLSLSEFFAFIVGPDGRLAETFPPEPVDGPGFWEVVAAINPVTSFGYRHRVPCDEQLYPFESPSARFTSQTGVPAILVTTLPHLTDDHDLLFDTLRAEVTAWPAASIGEHYRRLFGWLERHFGKRLWVERSGAALHMVEHYAATFPNARFVHLARDGRDVALSLQGHLGMRLYLMMSSIAQSLGVDPLQSEDRTYIDRVPAELRRFLPEHFDAEAFRALRLPLALCGQYWSFQVENGMTVLPSIPQDRLLTLRYEEILADPKPQLDTLAAFLGEAFVDDEWSARCAATVRKPKSTWRDLPEDDARTLTEACRPGFEHLRAAGVHYDA
jgi:Sulfotransferase domain/Sulfotransferase family